MSEASSFVLVLAVQGTPLDQAVGGGAAAPGAAGALVPGTTGGTGPQGGAPAARGGDSTLFLMILSVIAVMFIMTIFTGRRQRKQRETMLGSLRKHDRVMTTGGIIGSVIEIKPRTVVLKVDESSNTRITFSRESIQQVLADAAESTGSEAKS